jgi:hypothetical protein
MDNLTVHALRRSSPSVAVGGSDGRQIMYPQMKGFPRSEEEIPIWLFKMWKTNTAEICGIWLSINQDICILGEYRRKEPASCPDAGRLLGPKNQNRVLTTKVFCPIVHY